MDAEVRAAYERRLKMLQIRAAQMGIGTPIEVLTEIEDIEKLLAADDNAAPIVTLPNAISQKPQPSRQRKPSQTAIVSTTLLRSFATYQV